MTTEVKERARRKRALSCFQLVILFGVCFCLVPSASPAAVNGQCGVDHIDEYGLAQGIGLSLNEWPRFDGEASGNLEEGMCLSLRLGVKDKTRGALMLGNTLHVSKTGVDILTE